MDLKFKKEWLDRIMNCPMTGNLINTSFINQKEKQIWYSKPGLKHMFENDIPETKSNKTSNSNFIGKIDHNKSSNVDLGDSGSDNQ